MRRQPDSFAAAVRAFRELTAAGDEAAATRARVLAAAERTSRGYASPRRISLPTVAGLLVICTASVAGTTVAKRWARPLAIALVDSAPPASPRSRDGYRAVVVIPTAPPADEDGYASGPADAEAAAYGRAHRAHFAGSQPERAKAGSISVYSHTTKPAESPASAPRRVPPFQKMPPSTTGALLNPLPCFVTLRSMMK